VCGIAGILTYDRQSRAPTEVLDRMLDTIIHRGPDDDGRLVDRELAMGMRRLSIIDLVDGKQPMFDCSARYGIVFNGEIYNYRELHRDLESRGHKLSTHSDTEVIIHLFEELGPECLHQLRGMFAFAIWDNRERELFIARDRLGIKPLYYTEIEGSLIFASEIKALLDHPAVGANLDYRSLSQYLSLKYVPAPNTMFAGIRSLEPGHSLYVRNGQAETSRYWDISFKKNKPIKTDDEYTEELLHLLRESVELRLRSDVPFGAFLSGGLDSSIIVALMAEVMEEPVKTFSVGFSQAGHQDELPYAQQVADHFGCEHHSFEITAKDFLDHAENVLWHMDQPISDHATVATYMVAKLARQHVKMVLTGEGGDELFAGYARYEGERLSFLNKFVPASLGQSIRSGVRVLPGLRRAKIAIDALTIKDEATRFANWFPMLSDDMKAELLTGPMAGLTAGAANVFRDCLDRSDATDPLDRMLYTDTKLWLADFLLLRGDKLTMANSLEARVPLLDHKLVEFAASLPTHMKLRGRTRKFLLKKAGSTLLPESIVNRKKQGFPIPIDHWLRNEARELVNDLLCPKIVTQRGLFDPGYVSKLVADHESGYFNFSKEIWGLVSVEMWMQKFVDPK
jgi:asparagine synthase (glutamine-hydrolysing)